MDYFLYPSTRKTPTAIRFITDIDHNMFLVHFGEVEKPQDDFAGTPYNILTCGSNGPFFAPLIGTTTTSNNIGIKNYHNLEIYIGDYK